MEDRVEAYLGEEARINCMFTSAEGVGALRIHWFFVSLIKPETQESFAVCLHGMFHVIEIYGPLGDSVR